MSNRFKDQIVPLTNLDLDLLGWFASWTPEVHHANWATRRTWPPGFREAADDTRRDNDAIARMAHTGVKNSFRRIRDKLLPFRLVEGTLTCARLTARGRSALKVYGRECPDHFDSHCAEIFDNVDLRIRFGIDFRMDHLRGMKTHYRHGEVMDDTMEVWRACMLQYNENVYSQRGMGQSATVAMLKSHGATSLNGSLREHNDVVTIRVRANNHREICEFRLSLEQLADMLVTQGEVPCTVNSYYGPDGMRYSEPAAPVVSAYVRMQARLENQTDNQAERIAALIIALEEGKFGKMGKRGKEALLHELGVVKDLGIQNHAYTAQQTLEEVSQVIEGAGNLLQERIRNGQLQVDGGVLTGLLPDQQSSLFIDVDPE